VKSGGFVGPTSPPARSWPAEDSRREIQPCRQISHEKGVHGVEFIAYRRFRVDGQSAHAGCGRQQPREHQHHGIQGQSDDVHRSVLQRRSARDELRVRRDRRHQSRRNRLGREDRPDQPESAAGKPRRDRPAAGLRDRGRRHVRVEQRRKQCLLARWLLCPGRLRLPGRPRDRVSRPAFRQARRVGRGEHGLPDARR
jgi:hypothetical protein